MIKKLWQRFWKSSNQANRLSKYDLERLYIETPAGILALKRQALSFDDSPLYIDIPAFLEFCKNSRTPSDVSFMYLGSKSKDADIVTCSMSWPGDPRASSRPLRECANG